MKQKYDTRNLTILQLVHFVLWRLKSQYLITHKYDIHDKMLTTNVLTSMHLKLSDDTHVGIVQNDVIWHELIQSSLKTVWIIRTVQWMKKHHRRCQQSTFIWLTSNVNSSICRLTNNKHPMEKWPLFRQAILNCKVGHTDLVFGMRSSFISRSVHLCACKITSLCVQQLQFVPPWLTPRHTSTYTQTTFWPGYMKSSASWAKNNNNKKYSSDNNRLVRQLMFNGSSNSIYYDYKVIDC